MAFSSVHFLCTWILLSGFLFQVGCARRETHKDGITAALGDAFGFTVSTSSELSITAMGETETVEDETQESGSRMAFEETATGETKNVQDRTQKSGSQMAFEEPRAADKDSHARSHAFHAHARVLFDGDAVAKGFKAEQEPGSPEDAKQRQAFSRAVLGQSEKVKPEHEGGGREAGLPEKDARFSLHVVQTLRGVGIAFEPPKDDSSLLGMSTSLHANALFHANETTSESIRSRSHDKPRRKEHSWHSPKLAMATLDIQGQIFAVVLMIVLGAGFWWWAKKVKFFQRYREMIPFVGKFLRKAGVDKYDKFEINIIIHEVTYSEKFESYVQIAAGYNSVQSGISRRAASHRVQGAMAATFNSACSLVVPQGAQELKVKLLDKSEKNILAEGHLNVDTIFNTDKDEMVVQMVRKGQGKKLMNEEDPKVILTIYYKQGDADGKKDQDQDSDSAVDLLEGLDTEVLSLALKLEIEKISGAKARASGLLESKLVSPRQLYQHQLDTIADTCCGNLSVIKGMMNSTKLKYFHLFQQIEKNQPSSSHSFLHGWRLGWWDMGKDSVSLREKPGTSIHTMDKKPPEGQILILYVQRVTPDANRPSEFVVEYIREDDELEETQKLALVCKERSREYWVESLSVFINHLRKVRSDVSHHSSESERLESEKHKSTKHKSTKHHKSEKKSTKHKSTHDSGSASASA